MTDTRRAVAEYVSLHHEEWSRFLLSTYVLAQRDRIGQDGDEFRNGLPAIWGHQVVLLVWTDGRVRVPLGIRLWKKGGYSKVELAAQLLREAERRGIRPEYVLFDSWYAAASLLHLLESMGWKYVARLKANRLFEGQKVRQRWPHRFGRAVGRLRKVSHEVCVVKDGRRYFVSNDTGVWVGRSKRTESQSAGRTFASRTLCAVHQRAGRNQRRADDLCVQAQLISFAHPGASTAVRRL